MRLPFAVFTATEGYGWTAGLSHGRATLERMRRAVGKTPDFDYGARACSGVVNDGDTVAVYRFMRAEKWDSKGRNVAYLALSFFPRASAGAVDVERLLTLDPFRVPLRSPPEWLEYEGGFAAVSTYDPVSDVPDTKAVDFFSAGNVFAKPFTGTLRLCREEGGPVGRCRVVYTPALQGTAETGPAACVAEERARATAAPMPSGPASEVVRKRFVWRPAFAAVLAAALGAVVGMAGLGVLSACGWRPWGCGRSVGATKTVRAEQPVGVCKDGVEQRAHGLFDEEGRWKGVAGIRYVAHAETRRGGFAGAAERRDEGDVDEEPVKEVRND